MICYTKLRKVFYDIIASARGRGPILDLISRVASQVFIPFCVGGGIGTIAGMYTFRHKTKKTKFTIGIPAILILEIILLVYELIIK